MDIYTIGKDERETGIADEAIQAGLPVVKTPSGRFRLFTADDERFDGIALIAAIREQPIIVCVKGQVSVNGDVIEVA